MTLRDADSGYTRYLKKLETLLLLSFNDFPAALSLGNSGRVSVYSQYCS